MQSNNKNQYQLFALGILLPLTWLMFVYSINQFWFVEDKLGSIRLIILVFIIHFYTKLNTKNTLFTNFIKLLSIFIIYLATFYIIDLLVNFLLNKNLKFDFYDAFYHKSLNDGSEQELKSLNSGYRIASKEQMISSLITTKYSFKSYVKNISFDILKVGVISFLLVKINNDYAK